MHRLRPPLALLFLSCAGLVGCDGGGGGGSDEVIVSGTVRSPDGQGIGLAGRAAPHLAQTDSGGATRIELPGLLPVPDGTSVALVRLDATGAVEESLAETSTAGGQFSFDLSSLGLGLAADLLVVAGSGTSELRAPAARTALDVDPLSEVLVQLLLGTGALPLGFTVDELADLDGTLKLLARLEDFAAQPDLGATLDDWFQTAQADADFGAFLQAAADPGQTDQGPGDMGDYFPASVGDVWGLAGGLVENGGPSTAYTHVRRILSAAGDGVRTIRDRQSLEATASEELLLETGTGVLYVDTTDASDPLGAVTPFELVRFPLTSGESWEQFDVRGVSLGFDLDGDQHDEVLDFSAVRTLVGFEDVSVAAGSFADCARFDTTRRVNVYFTSGPLVRSTESASDWFAPGIGAVRSESDLVLTGASIQSREERGEELASYQAGARGHGILPSDVLATDLAPGSADQESPGRPGLASDGSGYLLVTSREDAGATRLVGLFLGPTGLVQDEVELSDLDANTNFPRPGVVFDGANYLVVFQDEGKIQCLRVSPAGSVLDPAGIPVSTTGTSNFQPGVAFDGTNALVVWRKFDDVQQGEVFGARVTPGGSVLGEFPIVSAPGEQQNPAVVFGAGNYLVVYADPTAGIGVRAVRVAPDETVLDPGGFDVAASALAEDEPAASFDGTNYLVVWRRQAPNFAFGVFAARVAPAGTVLDADALSLSAPGLTNVHPSVTFDGTNSLVSWQVDGGTSSGIRVTRISPAGALLDGVSSGGLSVATPPSSARLAYPVLARGTLNRCLAWIVNRELAGEQKDLEGTLVYPF